ncbi:hypothetical protein C8R46DRAFT_1194962 [Mycena filopes]|nr:hypothetical protein C8R46DRAFT_1194962 [Mycena filopes]
MSAPELGFRANSSTSTGWRPMISTVASDDLRDILHDRQNTPSRLARETITHQLEAYDEYLSAPRRTSAELLPSLVDVAAEKLPEPKAMLPIVAKALAVSQIGFVGNNPSSYQNSAPSERRLHSPLVYVLRLVQILSFLALFGRFRGGKPIQSAPKLRICDLVPFPEMQKEDRGGDLARKITRAKDLLGYKILDSKRQLAVQIQPSITAFQRTFDRMSDGLLKNLNWDNVVVAGGIVLGALLGVDTPTGKTQAKHWQSSDIDVYIHGLGPKDANKKLQYICSTFKANLPAGGPTLVVRNAKTITFYSRYPLRRIQVVLKLVKSPKAVLLNFDLDICGMGWDGERLWMLPRAVRALETGYNTFTMNLIQGHYLSERRATQEQRVFKYANKGYGIRILPSNVNSLEESQSKIDDISRNEDISRDEDLFPLDMDKIAKASRMFTATVVKHSLDEYEDGEEISHFDLDNKHQISSEPQGRSCLSSFSLFMRHVELWDMEQREEIVINESEWASTTYGDFPETITDWLDRDPNFMSEHGLDEDGAEFKAAARLTYGANVTEIMQPAHNVVLPVLLPVAFAAFANDLVGDAQEAAGLKVKSLVTPAVKSHTHLVVSPRSKSRDEGLFLWRIGKEGIVSEALYAFYRVNDRLDAEHQNSRLILEISRRAPVVEDEFEAFARWIGRQPIFVRQFFNHVSQFGRMRGQLAQYRRDSEESDGVSLRTSCFACESATCNSAEVAFTAKVLRRGLRFSIPQLGPRSTEPNRSRRNALDETYIGVLDPLDTARSRTKLQALTGTD